MATTETKLSEVQRLISGTGTGLTMKALVYHGPGKRAWEEKPRPALADAGDAIVRITTTTICGTDLHILKGDVPSVTDGRILGHEGIGIVEEVGSGVHSVRVGDKVLVSCITSCGRCDFCRKGMYSHCRNGGWILGNRIDGTQAEYVRIPHADTSLYLASGRRRRRSLGDAERHPAHGLRVRRPERRGQAWRYRGDRRRRAHRPGGLLTAQFYSPAAIIMIDLDGNRLKRAEGLGATAVINSADGNAVGSVLEMTDGAGVDVAIEAVGVPATFDICQAIVARRRHESPTSASTARPSSCTSRSCGIATSRSRRGWSIRRRRRCC